MTKHTILEPLRKDQWLIESQELPSFVPTVQEISACTIIYRRVDNSDTKAHAQLQVTEVRRRIQPFAYSCEEASYVQRIAKKGFKEKASLQPDDVWIFQRSLQPGGGKKICPIMIDQTPPYSSELKTNGCTVSNA